MSADASDCIRLDNQICFPLYACAKEVTRQYRKPLQGLNLTYTQYIVMMALWEHGEMSEGELGQIVHLDSGTLTPLLKRLEKQGYVNRIRPADNERKLLISLTVQGDNLKERAASVPGAVKNCLGLPDEELSQFKGLLEKALRNMETAER